MNRSQYREQLDPQMPPPIEYVDEPFGSDLPTHAPFEDILFDGPFDDEMENPFGPPEGKPAKKPSMTELVETDLAHFFGNQGPLSEQLSAYEMRPSQLEMAQSIKRALLKEENALIEAPTGTGKSLAYLVPAILSGKTVVVATANKSLQNQLYTKDIPFLRKVLNRPIQAVVVKGRSNFVCTHKWDKEAQEQQRFAFVDREHEQISFMRRWLKKTETGDVDDLPFMLDSDLRPRVVSYPDDCLHSDCTHAFNNCWVNAMRDRAVEAQVLITNHHLLLNALELGFAGERILPPAPIYVIDEAHQLEHTATSVFETNVTDYTVEQLIRRNIFEESTSEERIEEIRFQNTIAFQEVARLSRDNSFRIEPELEDMKKLSRQLSNLAEEMKKNNPHESPDQKIEGAREMVSNKEDDRSEARKIYELAIEALGSTARKVMEVATSRRDENFVRYAVRLFDRRHVTLEVHAAPIDPAMMLNQYLFHPEEFQKEEEGPINRTVVCTSATLATNGSFDHFKTRCGVGEAGEAHILPPVFDYPKQAQLYQPSLPAYNWRNTDAYYNGVTHEIRRLLEVSRGRALCLFTSWGGLQEVSNSLRDGEQFGIWPIRAQGDAPRNTLLDWFIKTPYSVLLATKSFWEGVDIPGDDLSLVVVDKLPFPTPKDPLHSARMASIEEAGNHSFGHYMLPLMTLDLKQGFGRLIRRASDRGVVAILDERLTSKGYGLQIRRDLPPARFSRNFKEIHKFYQDALSSQAEFALNVWAKPISGEDEENSTGVFQWGWQLLRLQDGKADGDDGFIDEVESRTDGEIYAAIIGLRNLQQRIERAGRSPSQFGVEVRCCVEVAEMLNTNSGALQLQDWRKEQARWKAVEVLGIEI